MTSSERREGILQALREANAPLNGTVLGERFGVSRQVVVQDMALLRSSGHEIGSTNRGYVLHEQGQRAAKLVKVRHSRDQIAEELNAIVDLGVTVEDVLVNHRTYGLIAAPLNISSRRDVKRFIEDLENGISSPLMNVTDGYHFHNLSADDAEVLDECLAALDSLGFLAEFTAFELEQLDA